MKSFYLSERKIRRFSVFSIIALCLILVSAFFDRDISAAGENIDSNYKENLIYHGSTEKPDISFAINVDWGEEYIPEMLNIFSQNDVNATFFLTGRWCENNQDLAKEIHAAGHEIGNHAYSHKSPDAMTFEENLEEINKTSDAIFAALNIRTTLYAPPSGECAKQVYQAASESGHKLILWTADTIDWQKPEPSVIINRILSKLDNGVIVLMHPTENTVKALPAMINEIKKQGYNLVTVSENIGL